MLPIAGQYEENWAKLPPELELTLNTSRNASTGRSLYEVVYGSKPRLGNTPKSDATNSGWLSDTAIMNAVAATKKQNQRGIYDSLR